MPATTPRLRTIAAILLLALGGALSAAPHAVHAGPVTIAAGAIVPAGFRDELLIGGLVDPTAAHFAADGRIFVAEKRGWIWVYDSPSDTTPTRFANLQDQVYNIWDRGMLGMVLDPKFTTGRPYVYVAYTYNHILGQHPGDPNPPPRWPSKPAPFTQRRLPESAGLAGRLCRLKPGFPVDGERQHNGDRLREGPRRRLVPAVCEPRDRVVGVRSGGRAVRDRR